MIDGKLVWLQEEGSKRRYQYCSDNSGTILYLRAFQGHSGNNLIDPMLQDNVVIGTGIFPYIYHVGCTFNLHSIINNGIGTWEVKNLSRRQTVFFLPVDPRWKSKRPWIYWLLCTTSRAIHAQCMEEASRRGIFVDIDLAIKEGLTFYQTRSKAIILQGTLPAHCI